MSKLSVVEYAEFISNSSNWRERYARSIFGFSKLGHLTELEYEDTPFALAIELWDHLINIKGAPKSAWFTPKKVAIKMVELAEIEEGETVMDPCAGIGVLLKVAQAAGGKTIGYEIDKWLVEVSKELDPKLHIMCRDFLEYPRYEHVEYKNFSLTRPTFQPNVVLLNPPTGKQQGVADIAMTMLLRVAKLYEKARAVVVLPKGFFSKKAKRRNTRAITNLFDIDEVVALHKNALRPWFKQKPVLYRLSRR